MTTPRFRILFSLLPCALALLAAPALATEAGPRERLLLDFGWKFHLGNEWGIAQNLAKAGTGCGPASVAFSDASWRPVNLPHDWAVELPFDRKADGSHGFKPVGDGFPQTASAGIAAPSRCPRPMPAGASGWNSTACSATAPCSSTAGSSAATRAATAASATTSPTSPTAAARTSSPCGGCLANSRAGSTKARASTATSGW